MAIIVAGWQKKAFSNAVPEDRRSNAKTGYEKRTATRFVQLILKEKK